MTTRRSLAGLLLVALAAAGCGVGTRAETNKERSTPYRAGANAGDIAIRAVRIVLTGGASASAAPAASASPAPGIPTVQAYLSATLVNSGDTPDTLTSATIAGGAAQTDTGGVPDVTVPPAQVVQLGTPDSSAAGSPMLGVGALATPLVVGSSATVTFTFASAGTVSLEVPIIAPEDLGTTASAAPVTAGG